MGIIFLRHKGTRVWSAGAVVEEEEDSFASFRFQESPWEA